MNKKSSVTALCLCAFLAVLALFTPNATAADEKQAKPAAEKGLSEQEKLTGDWGGLRTSLEEKGLSIELVYKADFAKIFQGGLKTNDGLLYLDNVDLKFTVDTGKAGLWNGGTFFLYGLSNHGSAPSEWVGDLQVTSNIEAFSSTRVFQLWYQQAMFEDRFSALFGLHDFNSEFYTSQYAGLFLNSSFGVGPSVSHSVPVSIFNVSAVGLRLKANPLKDLTILAAIYDGNPGSAQDNPGGLNITIDTEKEGTMQVAEVQYAIGGEGSAILPGAYRLGVWQHTGKFEDMRTKDGDGNPVLHKNSEGFYITLDQQLYDAGDGRGLGVFGQYGIAPKTHSSISRYYGAGLHYTGLIPGREHDMLGAAVAHAEISEDLSAASRDSGGPDLTSETTYEFTYQAHVVPWFTIQPDYQIVVNPGGDTSVSTAHIGYFRVIVAF